MRRAAVLILGLAMALLPATADAEKHQSHKPSGVEGTVFNGTCPGACQAPPPPEPVYSGDVTITVARAGDGRVVASEGIADGHFKLRVKRGLYNVSSVPPSPPPCQPTPTIVCPVAQARSEALIAPCLRGETKQVKVRRHRFTQLDLQVSNSCIV